MYTAVSGQSTLADNLAYHVFEGGCFFVCQLCAELEPKSWTNGHLAAHMAYWCMLGIVKGPKPQQGWHLHSARCECNPSATGWAAAMVWLKYYQILQRPQQISTNKMRKKKISKKRRKNQESLLSPLLLASCSHIGSEARILTWPRPKKDVEHRVGTQNNMSWQHRFHMFSRYCRSETQIRQNLPLDLFRLCALGAFQGVLSFLFLQKGSCLAWGDDGRCILMTSCDCRAWWPHPEIGVLTSSLAFSRQSCQQRQLSNWQGCKAASYLKGS